MIRLPDEIWTDILDYLDPVDIVSVQRVSSRVLELARDSSLWRNKVFEKAPSAAQLQASKPDALDTLTGALGGLSVGDPTATNTEEDFESPTLLSTSKASRRAKAIVEWDSTHASENVDWYSEYIARHAPLSTDWFDSDLTPQEIRGVALFENQQTAIGSLEDGTIAVWDISSPSFSRRKFVELGKSERGLLFQDIGSPGGSSRNTQTRSFGAVIENMCIDSSRTKLYVAVEDTLNEVDLQSLKLVSQSRFAWPIRALSRDTSEDAQLMVGTAWSLHVHDYRLPGFREEPDMTHLATKDDEKIAFFPNYRKGASLLPSDRTAGAPTMFSYSPPRQRTLSNRIEAYAHVEPGPQTILNHGSYEVVIAGRMPSIIFYDKRNFPKVQSAIHSGARLAGMATLPVPPRGAGLEANGDSMLVACGEYGGRGSLEIYELPWQTRPAADTIADAVPDQNEAMPAPKQPFSYRNRQEASSSKLLSVATQGTRIVFSDSEGMIKWVERDGRGLARRWNINAFQMNERGASISGEQVVRKMMPIPDEDTDRGMKGNGDILIWTGEKIGIVTTKPKPWNDHDELVQAFERGMNLNDEGPESGQEQEQEYATMMRRALERQADERRWMSRFGGRRW